MKKKVAIFFIFIVFIASFPMKAFASTDWYNNSWSYRKKITIDYTKIPNTNQSNFPVLISLTDADLQVHARSDGADILFTDATGTTKIPYEREQYINSSGILVAWVKVATLSTSVDTVFYMYYGNSGASDQQDLTGGTWDANFKGVWHSNNASITTIADSTANANTGTKYGVVGPVETTGKIGKAQNYNGSDDYIGIIPSGTLAGSFTVSAWAKVLDEVSHTVIGTRNNSDMSFDFKFENSDTVHGDIGDGTDWITTGADASFSYAFDTWYQIAYVVSPTGYAIYLDGNNVASGSYDESTPLFFDSDHNIFIGQVGYDDEWFNGAIDEVRISDVARSADWIRTEYNNQNIPASFYSLASEESAPIPTPTSTPTAASTPTQTPGPTSTPTSIIATSVPTLTLTPTSSSNLIPFPSSTPVPVVSSVSQKPALFDVVSEPVQLEQQSIVPFIILIVIMILLIMLAIFFLRNRKQQPE